MKVIDTAIEAKRFAIDALAAQKYKMKVQGDIDLGKFHTILKGWRFDYTGFDMLYGRLGMFINPKSINLLEAIPVMKGRIHSIRMKSGYTKVILMDVCAPTETQAESLKN